MSFLLRSSFSVARGLLASPAATVSTHLAQPAVALQRYKSTALLSPTPRKGLEVAVSSAIKAKTEGPGSAKAKKAKKGTETNATANTPKPSGYWVDASLTHIAVLMGRKYKVFKLKEGWATDGRDINWAETAAFELLGHLLVAQGRRGTVTVNSDSLTALRAVTGPGVKVKEIMGSARRLESVIKESGVVIRGVQVPSNTNLADPFTRGKPVEGYKAMKTIINIPEALAKYVAAD